MSVRRAATFLLMAMFCVTVVSRALAQTPSWAKVSPKQTAAAKKLGVPTAFENSVGMRFVLIPPGTFMMGSKEPAAEVADRCNMPNAQSGWFVDEHPRHKVALTTAFYMSIHEVTQGSYEAVTSPDPKKKNNKKKTPVDYPDGFKGDNLPVVKVSSNHIKEFLKILGKKEAEEGREYFLPTEAQWEYACRAGTETPFSFGVTVSTNQANYHGGYTYGDGKKGQNREKPVPVGSLPPNAWGLYEMHGNVSEWCTDGYGPYSSAANTDPTGPEKAKQQVLRGGSWRSYPGACRSSFRMAGEQRSASLNVGLRVCCGLPKEPSKEP
jgi:sulfatase modifying factor 1